MTTFLERNGNTYRGRHYIRKATASNHWFDFSFNKMQSFIKKYGDNFYLVIDGSEIKDDTYVIPYSLAKPYFLDEYLDSRKRWIGTVIDHRIKIASADHSISVAEFHNRFELLKAKI